MAQPPEGSSEITTSIGGRCKARKSFSRPVLISREAWPVNTTNALHVFPASRVQVVVLIGVAMAEGSHLFPYRTEKLSPPAPMVLPGRPGGRVGRRPDIFAKAPAGDCRGLLLAPRARLTRVVQPGRPDRTCRAIPDRRAANGTLVRRGHPLSMAGAGDRLGRLGL